MMAITALLNLLPMLNRLLRANCLRLFPLACFNFFKFLFISCSYASLAESSWSLLEARSMDCSFWGESSSASDTLPWSSSYLLSFLSLLKAPKMFSCSTCTSKSRFRRWSCSAWVMRAIEGMLMVESICFRFISGRRSGLFLTNR